MLNNHDIILKEFFKVCIINSSDRLSVIGVQEFARYNRFLTLLKLVILEEPKIQRKLEHMKYFLKYVNEPEIQPVFIEADDIIISLKKQQKPDYELFVDLFYKKLDDMQRNSHVDKYTLYYPVNITTTKSEITEFHINGITITILNYSDIVNEIDNKKLENEFFKVKGIDETRYQYAKVSVWCRSEEYARQKATPYVNFIVWVISYSKALRNESYILLGFSKPLIRLDLNSVFIFKNGSYSIYHDLKDASNTSEFYELEDRDIENLNQILIQFSESNKKIQEIIYNSMKQYHLGLIEKNSSWSFLNFWTSLEILTLKDRNLSHLKVKERLKCILKMNDIHEYQIERLYNLRNNLVHNGNCSEITQFDRNLMKAYVEILFQFFMFNFSKHRYFEISTIYELLQKDIVFLEEANNSANSINLPLINEVVALKNLNN